MEVVDTTQINSLPSNAVQADFVKPADEPVFILTSSRLQDIIERAIQKATEPLIDRIARLEELEEVYHGPAPQPEEIPLLRDCLTRKREVLNDLPSRVWSIEEDLSKMEEARPTATTATESGRIERIEKLCQDAPGHTISLSELRGRLGIDKSVLSRLLKKIDREKFYLKKASHDRRVRYLCIRPEMR